MSMNDGNSTGYRLSRAGLVFCILLGAAVILLLLEHRAHVLGWLPLLLILLVCGGAHFFMHGRHGDDSGNPRVGDRGERRRS